MLQTDMKEKIDQVVDIDDASMKDVRELVTYMYSGTTDDSYRRFRELLILGDRYQVLELVNFCSFKLSQSLSVENALELAIFGDMYHATILVEKCAKFISLHQGILKDDWMEKIEGSPKLMAEIIKNMKKVGSDCLAVMSAAYKLRDLERVRKEHADVRCSLMSQPMLMSNEIEYEMRLKGMSQRDLDDTLSVLRSQKYIKGCKLISDTVLTFVINDV